MFRSSVYGHKNVNPVHFLFCIFRKRSSNADLFGVWSLFNSHAVGQDQHFSLLSLSPFTMDVGGTDSEPTLPHVEVPDPRRGIFHVIYLFLRRRWLFFGLVWLLALVGISIGVGWTLRLQTFDIVTEKHTQAGDIPMLTEYVS